MTGGLTIEPRLPHFRGEGRDAPEFKRLVGSTILRIGTAPELDIEGGGLIIEIRLAEDGTVRLLKLGFNEVGMWIDP